MSTAPERQVEVGSAMSILNDAAINLENAFENLASRLTPVTRQIPTSDSEGKAACSFNTPLATEISQKAERIEAVTKLIRTQLELLEV